MRKLSVMSAEAYDARGAAKVGCRRRPRHVIAPPAAAARRLPARRLLDGLAAPSGVNDRLTATLMPQPQPTMQASTRPTCYSRCASGAIAAVHPDAAAPALADPACFPALACGIASQGAPLTGAWARRAAAAAAASTASVSATLADDAEDVAARPSTAASTPYLLPAKRPGASPALLIGQAYPCPSIDALLEQRSTTAAALYIKPQRRTAEQAAAAAAAARPGLVCAWPQLVAGPQPACSSEAPAPRYRLALMA